MRGQKKQDTRVAEPPEVAVGTQHFGVIWSAFGTALRRCGFRCTLLQSQSCGSINNSTHLFTLVGVNEFIWWHVQTVMPRDASFWTSHTNHLIASSLSLDCAAMATVQGLYASAEDPPSIYRRQDSSPAP